MIKVKNKNTNKRTKKYRSKSKKMSKKEIERRKLNTIEIAHKISFKEHKRLTEMLTKQNGIELYQIVDHLPIRYYVLKKDLNKIKGKTIAVALLDRNFEEYGIWDLERYKLYKPTIFFKNNKATIKYNGGYTWLINYNYGESVEQDIEVNMVDGVTKIGDITWSPLDNKGYITCTSGKSKIHFNDLPNDTRIGWRGPMIYWDFLKTFASKKKVYQASLEFVTTDKVTRKDQL